MQNCHRLSNPILGDTSFERPRGIRTYTKQDNITNQCEVVQKRQVKTPNRHIIPDHSYEHFHHYNKLVKGKDLRKKQGTFEPKLDQKDALSRKISNIYSKDLTASKSAQRVQQSPQLSANKRRMMDNKSQILNCSPYDVENKKQETVNPLPSDVNWFYVDTIKHKRDYQIAQSGLMRSSYLDQRSCLDGQQLHLKNVKKSQLLNYKK